ncbi:MAG TPA: energy transducer TonB [Thermoanaerobaculia bacterium]
MKSNPLQLVDLVEEKRKPGRFSLAVVVSAIVHALLFYWAGRYRPDPPPPYIPIQRFVDLTPGDPREFVEAPGRKVDQKPLNAPLSDANRRASGPNPVEGMPRTNRPGDGGGLYQPPMGNPQPRGPRPSQAAPATQQQQQQSASQQAAAFPPPSGNQQQVPNDQLAYQQRTSPQQSSPSRLANLNDAIASAGRPTRGGGGDGLDIPGTDGGEKGSFAQGPVSFESEWFDWGEYTQGMVSKIRVHWYAAMPQFIRTGMKGRVVIRLTIHRDGRISDVTILEPSGVPPYDHAAKKAIEQSSPLKPLPENFPKETERVTCVFYYNYGPDEIKR